MRRKNKYGAIKVQIDGIMFDSKREGNRYLQLKLLAKAGKISDFAVKPKSYSMDHNGVHICKYIPDFEYYDNETQKHVVEDCKGMKTGVYNIKKKMMKAFHEIEVAES